MKTLLKSRNNISSKEVRKVKEKPIIVKLDREIFEPIIRQFSAAHNCNGGELNFKDNHTDIIKKMIIFTWEFIYCSLDSLDGDSLHTYMVKNIKESNDVRIELCKNIKIVETLGSDYVRIVNPAKLAQSD